MEKKHSINDLKITVSGRETSYPNYNIRLTNKRVSYDSDFEQRDMTLGSGCERKFYGEITVMAREVTSLVPQNGENKNLYCDMDDYYEDDGYCSWEKSSEENTHIAPYCKAAEIKITAYNLGKYGYYASDVLYMTTPEVTELFDCADECSGEESGYVVAFARLAPQIINQIKKKTRSRIDLGDMFLELDIDRGWLITLDRFYIEPKFRRLGLSRFLRENLHYFISNIFHIDPAWLVAYIKPDDEDGVDVDKIREVVRSEYKNKQYAILEDDTNYCASLLLSTDEIKRFFPRKRSRKQKD